MNCSTLKSLILDYLEGSLDPMVRKEFEDHLNGCPSCRQEVEHVEHVRTMLGDIPEEEPSPVLQSRFETMLDTYRHGMNHTREKESLRERLIHVFDLLWPKKPAFQAGFAVLCLILGVVLGTSMNRTQPENGEMDVLREEVRQMKQMVSLSLLEQPSATERLRGVNLSSTVIRPDSLFLTALLETLNNDRNVNVRLAAVDALYLFSSEKWIREELVHSLKTQISPLVQVALIDLLVEIREKKALDALRNLINDQNNIEPVRKRAREGIEQIS